MNARETEEQELRRVALAVQDQLRVWRTATTEPAKARCRQDLEQLLDSLHALLLGDLHRLAYGWLRSPVSGELDSSILNLFAHMLDRLETADLTDVTNLRRFLCMLAWRGYADQHKREQPKSTGIDPDDERLGQTANAADAIELRLDSAEKLAAVFAFWDRALTPSDRDICYLWFSEVSLKEIAIRLHMTHDNARQRHSRLMKRTRAHLEGLGFEP